MTDAREIWSCSNCDGLFYTDENCTCDRPNWNGEASQSQLHATGFRILGKDEVDPVTVEKCAEVTEMYVSMGWRGTEIIEAIRALGRKA